MAVAASTSPGTFRLDPHEAEGQWVEEAETVDPYSLVDSLVVETGETFDLGQVRLQHSLDLGMQERLPQ